LAEKITSLPDTVWLKMKDWAFKEEQVIEIIKTKRMKGKA